MDDAFIQYGGIIHMGGKKSPEKLQQMPPMLILDWFSGDIALFMV